MAIWAAGMFLVSLIGTGIGTVGAVFVYKTLQATRDTVAVTQRIGEAQVRAYPAFQIESINITGTAEPRQATVAFVGRVTNTGASPAYGLSFRMDIQYVTGEAHSQMMADGEGMFETGPSLNTLSAGHHVRKKLARTLAADVSKIRSGEAGFRLTYVMRYIDVFGKEQFSPMVSGTTGFDGSNPIWMPDIVTGYESEEN